MLLCVLHVLDAFIVKKKKYAIIQEQHKNNKYSICWELIFVGFSLQYTKCTLASTCLNSWIWFTPKWINWFEIEFISLLAIFRWFFFIKWFGVLLCALYVFESIFFLLFKCFTSISFNAFNLDHTWKSNCIFIMWVDWTFFVY